MYLYVLHIYFTLYIFTLNVLLFTAGKASSGFFRVFILNKYLYRYGSVECNTITVVSK